MSAVKTRSFRSNTDTRIPVVPSVQKKRASSTSSITGNQFIPQVASQSPPQEDPYSPSATFEMGKYKTKLCRHWKTGYCLFGPSCVFAHGVDDLCEPNLLVQQMGNLVLVPLNMQGYGPVPMGYNGEAGVSSSNMNSVSPLSTSPPMSNGGLLSLPIFPYMPPSMAFAQPTPFQMVNQMPYYAPQKKEVDHNNICVLCSESLDGPKPKAFLPCMHEFHEACLQIPEKNIIELGCPSCPSSSAPTLPATPQPSLRQPKPNGISAE